MEHFQKHNPIFNLSLIFMAIIVGNTGGVAGTDKYERPSDKEIIIAIFQLSPLKLSSGGFCANISDSTVGQFLSTYWQSYVDTNGVNFLKINCSDISYYQAAEMLSQENKDAKKNHGALKNTALCVIDFYICRRYDNDNERWCWGIRFLMDKKNKTVVPGAFWCLGAG